MARFIDINEAISMIPDGATIMIGGYLGCGSPHKLISALSESGKGGFTVINNDAGMLSDFAGGEYYGIAKLVHAKQIKKLVVDHVGTNPEVFKQVEAGEMELTLVPQGSLAEMIRAGGAGLGGVLTPTGIGTVVEDADHTAGKVVIDGREYLVEKPLRANVAMISGYKIDRAGNIWYKGTTRNFNQVMATAADLVIAEADNVVEIGEIEPENVMTSGVFIDYIVDGGRA